MKRLFLLTTLIALCAASMGQTAYTGQYKNYISTGMPILLIAPDAISSGMGDAGVASTPDLYSGHWNNAKFALWKAKWAWDSPTHHGCVTCMWAT